MNSATIRLLFTLELIGIFGVARAQLPLRGTRWNGAILSPNDIQVVLTFHQDTLLITRQTDKMPIETIRYQQIGDTVYLRQVVGQSPCGTSVTGLYRLAYINNGVGFTLQPISDDCLERQNMFESKTVFVRIRPNPNQPPQNWPYLDPIADSVAGISLYKAYELLKGRPSVPVIVGVLDSGVDLTHEDLRDVIWVNPKEIPDNQTDDDKNGYADDRNGWNFMGAPDGTTY